MTSWIGAPETDARLVNMNHLGRALTEHADPPVNVLFATTAIHRTVPDQQRVLRGLERNDLFTVVFDQVMTDTALYADIILPATTFLEGYDFAKAYGPINLELGRPVIDAVGEARTNADVFGELCSRLDVLDHDEPSGELDLLVRVLDSLPGTIGDDLRAGTRAAPPFGDAPVQFRDVFPLTPDRKINLFPAALESTAPGLWYSLSAGPGHRSPLSVDAHLSGERFRTISFDARRAATPGRQGVACTLPTPKHEALPTP